MYPPNATLLRNPRPVSRFEPLLLHFAVAKAHLQPDAVDLLLAEVADQCYPNAASPPPISRWMLAASKLISRPSARRVVPSARGFRYIASRARAAANSPVSG